jgi:ABC-type antimicrobial peptide transport system permease subunit
MQIRDSVRSAWRIIYRNKIRSFLTMLGIIIGVMSVIIIMSVGAGAQSLVVNQVTSIGTNLVGILPGKSEENGPPAMAFGIVITTLKQADADAILAYGNPHIAAIASYVRGAATVTTPDGRSTDTTFVGTSASYPAVEKAPLDSGRFFTEEEDRSSSRVAVLGSGAADELFPDNGAVGSRIKIKRTNFLVIGVQAPRGTSGFQNQDNQIFVPIRTAQDLLLGIDYVSFMRAKIDDAAFVEESMADMTNILRQRHRITDPDQDDFSVRSANQGLAAITSITDALKFFLAAIAALSLFVGGIGIMNIMLAAVEERTKEIGLRKALGATPQDILWQFLIETAVITGVGGSVGILLGAALSALIAFGAVQLGYSWDLVLTPSSLAVGALVSVGIGFASGLTPARRASGLNPIEALRYE